MQTIMYSAVAMLALSSTGAHAADQQSARKLLQLKYVPGGCQDIGVNAKAAVSGGRISGSVTLTNPQEYDIPISKVQVQINNNIPVAPIFVTANCPGSVIPNNPTPYQTGTMTCTFSAALPTNGAASSPSAWTTVLPTATIGMSNAQCPGSPATITRAPTPAPNPAPAATCPSPITTTASYTRDLSAVQGTVVFSNPSMFNAISLDPNPTIQINNNANPSYAPLFGTLACPSTSVPRALFLRPGTLTCSFYVRINTSNGNNWSSFQTAFAKAGLADSSKVCSSQVVSITRQPLMGASTGSSSAGGSGFGSARPTGAGSGSAQPTLLGAGRH